MKISITWRIADGSGNVTDEYPVKAPLHAVKHIALAGIEDASPSDAGQYDVQDMNGETLDESKSLEELGVTDGARLMLKAKA